jgi:tetratricopeptide (TPR) repeat protein
MKLKNFLIILLCGCLPLTAHSQKLTAKQFAEKVQAIAEGRNLDSIEKTKNYPQLVNCYQTFISLYNKVGDKERTSQVKKIASNMYYNTACCYSLMKKKNKALYCLDQSIKLGYREAGHLKADTDFDNIRKEKKFNELVKASEYNSYLGVLKRCGNYTKEEKPLPNFSYSYPNDTNLVKVRQYFNLDSIAGSGDEISKIKNLMYWVHNTIRHDGSSDCPEIKNAISLSKVCKSENRGINCRMMAIMLNECYMAMGWKSRYITCMPQDSTDNDCHVINAVFSNTLNKWIWMDPTFAAYVMDDKGRLLGLMEVRERLIKDLPLAINDDANWNNKVKETKDMYLDDYMAKNLYQMECPVEFRFGEETAGGNWSKYIILVPHGFKTYRARNVNYITEDGDQFWSHPY